MMHAMDEVLFAATPLLPAPRFGTRTPPEVGGKQFLCASDGVYVAARSHAWDLTHRLATVPLPFGAVGERLVLTAGPIPRALLEAFISAAQERPDTEVAAAIVLDEAGQYRLVWPGIESTSGSHVSYRDGDIDDDRLVCDLHSHGRHRAFFSHTDDASDRSRRGPYLAIVVGACDSPTPELAARMVLSPYLWSLSHDTFRAAKVFA